MFKMRKINQSEIEKNSNVLSKIDKIKNVVKSKNGNTNNKTVYSSENNFYIETEQATYIETQDKSYHSYTFSILRDVDNGLLENLILSLQEDRTYKSFIITYDFAPQEIENLNNGLYLDPSNRFEIVEIDGSNLTPNIFNKTTYVECIIGTQTFWECDNDVAGHKPGIPGKPACAADGFSYVIQAQWGTCAVDDGNYGDPDNSDGGGSTNGGNTDGGSSDPSSDSNYDPTDPNIHGNGANNSTVLTTPNTPCRTCDILDEGPECQEVLTGSLTALTLTPDEECWLINHGIIKAQLETYYDTFGEVSFLEEAVEFLNTSVVQTFEEFIEVKLNEELVIEPTLLLDIDCDQIDSWITLAQHTPSASVKNKIIDLHQNNEAYLGDWNIQYLEDAGGSVVNMDYFAVKITTFPNNPSTGTSFTPNEFLDFFRKNINAFSGTYSQFEPYCEISDICTQETDLWNSTNPTSSIVKINIPAFPYPSGDMYGNDGVVVCSEYTNSYWNFMTMEAPYDSSHPVSGTRQFGVEENSDGSYNLYMRGVDRFENGVLFDLLDLFSEIPMVGPKDPFFGADELWKHIQVQLNTFLNDPSVGGVSTIVTPVTNRVNWEDVKDVLQGRKTKSDLGCN